MIMIAKASDNGGYLLKETAKRDKKQYLKDKMLEVLPKEHNEKPS